MAIIIELLSRNGSPLKQYTYKQESVSIGRGYDNDLRVDDPYVSENHCVVTQDISTKLIQFTDNGSLNGVKLNNAPCDSQIVKDGDLITIGRTRLRVFNESRPVAPAIQLSELEEKINWLNQIPVAVSLTVAFVLMLISAEYLNSFNEFKLSKIIPSILGMVCVFSGWPLIMGLLSKLSKKESRLTSQFSLLWIFLLLSQAISLISFVTVFNVSHSSFDFVLNTLLLTCTFFIFVWFSLFIAFHQSKTRRNWVAMTATAIVLVPTLGFKMLNSGDFSPRPSYEATLLPPMYKIVSSQSTDEFIQQSDALFQQVEIERDKDQD